MTYYSGRFSQEFLFQEIFAEICLRQEQMRVAELVFLHKIVSYFS
jgi:hypothetical protein